MTAEDTGVFADERSMTEGMMAGMMAEKVNVLLSAYNGTKYIEEQISSILSQTYQNFTLYLRDDGSDDGTAGFVRDTFAAPLQEGKLIVAEGENLGYAGSFFRLLEQAGEGQYWAFCDQDDVWLPDKLKWAVSWLQEQPEEVPALFHSAYELTDQTMEHTTGKRQPPAYPLTLRRMITDCVFQGFSIVMNRALREELLLFDGKNAPHDWAAGMAAVRFGRTRFDERIAVRHRRLPQSASSLSVGSRIRWFFRTKPGEADITRAAKAFEAVYADRLEPEEKKLLRLFTGDKYSLAAAFKKAFYPARWRDNLPSELALRLMMLGGKI